MSQEVDIREGPGVIPVETIRDLRVGMTEAEVLEIAGPPKLCQSPEATTGPTETFRELGFTIFDFAADRDLDAVWVYVHDRRGKFKLTKYVTTFVGFSNGVTTGAWQEVRDPPA